MTTHHGVGWRIDIHATHPMQKTNAAQMMPMTNGMGSGEKNSSGEMKNQMTGG